MRFRRAQHLRRTAEFDRVRESGRRRDCGAFFLHLREYGAQERENVRRLGVVASKRVGAAVYRNRAKRILREVFRRQQDELPVNCDVVMTARRSMGDADSALCERRFRAAIHRLREVIEKEGESSAS